MPARPIPVYRAKLPTRRGERRALLRVVRSKGRYLFIRITAYPGDPPFRSRHWTVLKEDLDIMVTTRLAIRISTLTCSSCHGTMSVYEGRVGKRPTVFFACSDCEDCFEI